MRMFFFGATLSHEPNRIYIAVIIHIDDRRVVALDGLLGHRVIRGNMEARLNSASLSRSLSSRKPLQRHAVLKRVALGIPLAFRQIGILIVGVLLPIDNGVVDHLRLPDGPEGYILIERAAKRERYSVGISPRAKDIARARRLLRGRNRYPVGRDEHGGDIGRLVAGLIGNPVAGFHLGVKMDVFAAERQGIARRLVERFVQVPAGDRFLRLHGEGDIARCDRIIRNAFLGRINAPLIVMEEDVVNLLKVGIERLGTAFAGQLANRAEGLIRLAAVLVYRPAHELVAVLLRRNGSVQLVARFDDLGSHILLAIVELVGHIGALRLGD